MSQDISVSFKSLFNSSLRPQITEFLSVVSQEDIFSICNTASNGRVKPDNLKEAVDAILLYTENIERLFSYQKIRNQHLKFYLQQNGFKFNEKSTKLQLLSDITKFWNSSTSTSVIPKSTSLCINKDLQNSLPLYSTKHNEEKKVKSDEFAHSFVNWFYSNLNSLTSPRSSFDSSTFCLNTKCKIYLISNSSIDELETEGAEASTELFAATVRKHNFSFSPNVNSGTVAKKSIHGLIVVLACGTLHVQSNLIGIFEQEFGLAKNPQTGSWQIFYTNMNLKSNVKVIPIFPPEEIFEVVTS